VLDYHLHLWPHTRSDAETTVEQVAAYCQKAVDAGVTEIAVTEHLFRFVQAKDRSGGFWDDLPGEHLRPGMSSYWDFHARVDLDDYVDVVLAVKAEGLPVVLGLEVDFYQDRMDEVASLLEGYPFDVLLGSVHWLGAWRFDVLNDPLVMAEWDTRTIDAVWDEYTVAMEELAASGVCDVFAHPDLVKVTGRVPAVTDEYHDRIAEAAVRSGMAVEVSSAGWRKPVAEEYPAPGLLRRLVDLDVPLTTASDAHALPDVADRADDLRRLLDAAGVRELRGYRHRRPYAVDLATSLTGVEPTGPGPDGLRAHRPTGAPQGT
jgi:histidinol-phosphatase (PHP family)